MPNKDRNKRSVRQARAREREELEIARAASTPVSTKKAAKAAAKEAKKQEKAIASIKNPGPVTRLRTYLRDVRSEMHRVVWPSKQELTNYSTAVIASRLVFGVAIWLVDTGFVAILAWFTGLHA